VENDRVALLLPGSPAYVDAVLRMLSAGIFPIPLDPRLTATEQERILAGLSPTSVVRTVDELRALVDRLPPAGLPGGGRCTARAARRAFRRASSRGLLAPEDAAALVAEERDLWEFSPEDVNLVLSPLYHSAPLRFAMGTILAGGRIVVPGPFDPAAVTAAIEAERPTTMFCVPTHLQRLFAHWDENRTPDLSSFRLVAHAGAPCPTDLKHRLVEAFPADRPWEFYGSTEGQFTACRSEEWLVRPGTVGRPAPAAP
jgi:long-chain acyl-CoA synthetase